MFFVGGNLLWHPREQRPPGCGDKLFEEFTEDDFWQRDGVDEGWY